MTSWWYGLRLPDSIIIVDSMTSLSNTDALLPYTSRLHVGCATAGAPTFRQEGPQPKAQKPDRKAAVFSGKCKCITVFTEQVATPVLTFNLGDQGTVLVRPLTTDQPGMGDSVSIARTPLSIAQRVAEVHTPLRHAYSVLYLSEKLALESLHPFARDQYAFQFNVRERYLQQLSKNSKQTLTEAEILQLRGHDGFSLLEIAVERFNPTVATVAKTLNDLELDNALSILIPYARRRKGLQLNENESKPLVTSGVSVHPSLQITVTALFTVRLHQTNPSTDPLNIHPMLPIINRFQPVSYYTTNGLKIWHMIQNPRFLLKVSTQFWNPNCSILVTIKSTMTTFAVEIFSSKCIGIENTFGRTLQVAFLKRDACALFLDNAVETPESMVNYRTNDSFKNRKGLHPPDEPQGGRIRPWAAEDFLTTS
ncbi:hypothetical protein CLF_109309 [Clonorchis sinensis]|uniref:Uncharacterized protein n=1 Tax=Clonorchis sinensis TaxID=79923 RepID=H2KSH3_CLOSI|nr:hypothetical protein CLF_109309 [Clonorchis sinensis]